MKLLIKITPKIVLIALLFSYLGVNGQEYFTIAESSDGNGNDLYTFTVNEDNLLNEYPLEGADAFYTFFWSFGDGRYSFEEVPSYVYPEMGNYEVMLIATPRYSGTPPPPAMYYSIEVGNEGNISYPYPEPMLFLDREPLPEHTSMAIINYKNTSIYELENARLRLYFREDYFTCEIHSILNNSTKIRLISFKGKNRVKVKSYADQCLLLFCMYLGVEKVNE